MSDIAKIIALGGGAGGGGGGGGTSDHRDLSNRSADDQHPMSAITGLVAALAAKGTYSKPADGIPYADLAEAVRESLDLAGTALQTAPVSSVNGKTGAVNLVPADLGLSVVFNLKGSKPTYADLPSSGNEAGDVWYVIEESVGYIWLNDGTVDRWEPLGMEIDLSAYYTKTESDAKYVEKDDLDEKQDTALTATVTIAVADWEGGTTVTKSVTGVTASNIVFCDSSDPDVQCTAQGAGTLTFTASATPTAEVTVKVVILP